MEATCQRCGETLSTEAAFCPHCAAPQLRWTQGDAEPQTEVSAAQPADPASPGRRVHWDSAIRVALLTSLITGILCSVLSPGILLWVVCGTAATITFYRRRFPQPLINVRLGARIGILFGVFTAVVLTVSDAAVMFYARYVLHEGSKFDQAYNAMLEQVAARAPSNPAATAQWNALMDFWHSAEARAGLFLLSAIFLALTVVLLCAAAGAITARFNRPHVPRSSNA
jgi:hypothetical protein